LAESKRIIVSLPDSLLREVDCIVAIEKKNRSEFIREAMKLYIREMRKNEVRENMKRGYREMAGINLALAELGVSVDSQALESYEAKISESD
jgi:CopG family transcriptional regulator / antitoxin EndoAI